MKRGQKKPPTTKAARLISIWNEVGEQAPNERVIQAFADLWPGEFANKYEARVAKKAAFGLSGKPKDIPLTIDDLVADVCAAKSIVSVANIEEKLEFLMAVGRSFPSVPAAVRAIEAYRAIMEPQLAFETTEPGEK